MGRLIWIFKKKVFKFGSVGKMFDESTRNQNTSTSASSASLASFGSISATSTTAQKWGRKKNQRNKIEEKKKTKKENGFFLYEKKNNRHSLESDWESLENRRGIRCKRIAFDWFQKNPSFGPMTKQNGRRLFLFASNLDESDNFLLQIGNTAISDFSFYKKKALNLQKKRWTDVLRFREWKKKLGRRKKTTKKLGTRFDDSRFLTKFHCKETSSNSVHDFLDLGIKKKKNGNGCSYFSRLVHWIFIPFTGEMKIHCKNFKNMFRSSVFGHSPKKNEKTSFAFHGRFALAKSVQRSSEGHSVAR